MLSDPCCSDEEPLGDDFRDVAHLAGEPGESCLRGGLELIVGQLFLANQL